MAEVQAGPFPRDASRLFLDSLAVPLAGALAGGVAVRIAQAGPADRPAAAWAFAVAGALAAALPLRYGVALAVVLASWGTFAVDFFGGAADYWNEAFAAVLAVRSVAARRPTVREAAVAAAVALVYAGYAVGGSSAEESFWGAKVLLTSVVIAWALVRLRPDRSVWTGMYYGLCAAAAGSVALAAWQSSEGVAALRALGDDYGERVRQTAGGTVRAFGGFSSPAGLAFMLAIALLVWLALTFVAGRDRELALRTSWLPPLCVAGIYLTRDRIAFLGLAAAAITGLALALRGSPSARRITAGVGVATAIASVALLASGRFGDTGSAAFRLLLWKEYASALSVTGSGPASAGSAYEHVAVERGDPPGTRFGAGWEPLEHASPQVPFRTMREAGTVRVTLPASARPPVAWTATVRALGRSRRLTIRRSARPIGVWRLSKTQWTRVVVPLPARGGTVPLRLKLTGRPGLAAQFAFVDVEGLPGRRPTEAERIYRRAFTREGDATTVGLGAAGPGVVDNLYLSWLFQYGLVLGLAVCAVWLGVLGRTILSARRDLLSAAAAMVAAFLVVAACGVNAWEEAPTDLLAAFVLSIAAAAGLRSAATARRRPARVSRSERREDAGPVIENG